ncbi:MULTISPECIES: thioredoxin family protein [unclassified Pseudoalteromonas]|uniref:thioredoxin family protein n=1 Tax=unclassified Pseudoalteromonas TaxID=194690 RepID=UPI0030154324
MSITDKVTGKLNQLESFTANSPAYFFPLKLVAWFILLLTLILTNMLALLRWPLVAIAKLARRDGTKTSEIVEVSSQEELKILVSKHDIVLVDFWADWCGPCLLMNSAIEDVSRKYSGEVLVAKVDASLNSTVSKSLAVRGLPTVIIFCDGVEFKRSSGALTVSQISSLIEEAKN